MTENSGLADADFFGKPSGSKLINSALVNYFQCSFLNLFFTYFCRIFLHVSKYSLEKVYVKIFRQFKISVFFLPKHLNFNLDKIRIVLNSCRRTIIPITNWSFDLRFGSTPVHFTFCVLATSWQIFNSHKDAKTRSFLNKLISDWRITILDLRFGSTPVHFTFCVLATSWQIFNSHKDAKSRSFLNKLISDWRITILDLGRRPLKSNNYKDNRYRIFTV
jgi:virulence-associated protein VagC